jgi:hypothetical protein
MTRTTVGIAHACRWPGCPYEASVRVGSVAVPPFPVCVRHAAAWHASTWVAQHDVAGRLNTPRQWVISSTLSPTDRLSR